jgi:hypothetical protein
MLAHLNLSKFAARTIQLPIITIITRWFETKKEVSTVFFHKPNRQLILLSIGTSLAKISHLFLGLEIWA